MISPLKAPIVWLEATPGEASCLAMAPSQKRRMEPPRTGPGDAATNGCLGGSIRLSPWVELVPFKRFRGDPQHGWFTMENPKVKIDDDWGYPHFRKHPDVDKLK